MGLRFTVGEGGCRVAGLRNKDFGRRVVGFWEWRLRVGRVGMKGLGEVFGGSGEGP